MTFIGDYSWIWILLVFVAYFATLIGIAVVRAPQMEDMSDYVLGGRRIGVITSALSSGSSSASGATMLVIPALAFTAGLLHLWTIVGITLGIWLTWTIMARRLRRYTIAADDSLTTPEFLEKRFMDRSGVLRTLCAAITIFFIIFYVSSGLVAGAKLLGVVFSLDYTLSILITLIAIASYTLIGGFLAVSRTDVFQAMIMLTGFIILPVTLIVFAYSADHHPLGDLSESLVSFLRNPLQNSDGQFIGVVFLLSAAGWGLGAFGAQRVLTRFMAVASESRIASSRNIGSTWAFLMLAFGVLLGLVARPALQEAGELNAVLSSPENLYFVVTQTFFHPVVAGLLLTAVVAAVMSTADSQLLLASAMATDDLPLIKRVAYSLQTGARVWMGRALLIAIGIIAAVLSVIFPDSVFNLVSLAWGGMGAAFGPLLILALYWRRFNLPGALTALVVGAGISTLWWYLPLGADVGPPTEAIGWLWESWRLMPVNPVDAVDIAPPSDAVGGFWNFLKANPGGLWDIQPATPGFLIALPAAIVVTLLTRPPSDEITKLFDQVNGPNNTEAAGALEES